MFLRLLLLSLPEEAGLERSGRVRGRRIAGGTRLSNSERGMAPDKAGFTDSTVREMKRVTIDVAETRIPVLFVLISAEYGVLALSMVFASR